MSDNKANIYITGDTHRKIDLGKLDTDCFPNQANMTKNDYLIIAGDAGVLWGDADDEELKESYASRPFTTLFIDGNHENHDMLDALPVQMWNGGKVHKLNDSLIHLMRGQVYTIGEKTFFTMGGASSTDRIYRKEGISWWAREIPSAQEYDEAVTNLQRHNFKVNYVITHCAPEGVTGIDRDQNSLTTFLDKLITDYKIQYDEWFCGHYHSTRLCGPIKILYNAFVNISENVERIPTNELYSKLTDAQMHGKQVKITTDAGITHQGYPIRVIPDEEVLFINSIYSEPINTWNIISVEII